MKRGRPPHNRPVDKPDQRKISELFRAVERDSNPKVYHGALVSDDGFNIVLFGVHDGEDSHLKERVLRKKDFSFSKLDVDVFEMQARRGVAKMQRDVDDAKLEFEAAEHNCKFAREQLEIIVRS